MKYPIKHITISQSIEYSVTSYIHFWTLQIQVKSTKEIKTMLVTNTSKIQSTLSKSNRWDLCKFDLGRVDCSTYLNYNFFPIYLHISKAA